MDSLFLLGGEHFVKSKNHREQAAGSAGFLITVDHVGADDAFYNIVDSMFMARLGVEALTAVSYVFPLQNIVLSLAVGFGVGINAVIAMNLGMGNQEKANQTATLGMALTVLHGLLFIVLGFLVARPFLELFTADEQIIQWGVQYAVIVFTFSMGYLLQISMEKIFQSVGEMMIPMVILASIKAS